jgi:hypothetical protein
MLTEALNLQTEKPQRVQPINIALLTIECICAYTENKRERMILCHEDWSLKELVKIGP